VAPLSGALGTALAASSAGRRGAGGAATSETPWTTTSSGLQYRDIAGAQVIQVVSN
jgi:hypothetical protein